jgi:hypothetical protein
MSTLLFSEKVKETLDNCIEDIGSRKSEFVNDPSRNFSRNRKLTLSDVIKATLQFGSRSLKNELREYYDYTLDLPTDSALVQQRNKIKSELFKSLFSQFTNSFTYGETFKKHRVLAIDGSDINIPHNPSDSETYIQAKPTSKGYNQIHGNFIYDLLNKVYVDVSLQVCRKKHERRALIDMMIDSPIDEKVILIGDRGYEGYNVYANIIKKGWKFLIRVQCNNDKCMVNTLNLPDTEEFDEIVHRILTPKQAIAKQDPSLYKYLSSSSPFDFFTPENPVYSISLRVVKVKLDDGSIQCFVTNLDKKTFDAEDIKELYHMRWGIETSFRDLKHTLALDYLHAKKKESILQEIYAKLTLYNFCAIITTTVKINKKGLKYDYQINFSAAVSICKQFLKTKNAFFPVEALIKKFISPIRSGRAYQRNIKGKTFISFNYRVA